MLPSLLARIGRVRPCSEQMPSVRIVAKQDGLGRRQTAPAIRGARNQCEWIAKTRRVIESRLVGSIAS